MTKVLTLTSKNQLTLPASFLNTLGIQKGAKLVAEIKDNTVVLKEATAALDEFAGSVPLPKKYKGKDIELIVEEAKRDYFSQRGSEIE